MATGDYTPCVHLGPSDCPFCRVDALVAKKYDLPRVDENGCYTLPNGECVGCPHCVHGPRSYDRLLKILATYRSVRNVDGHLLADAVTGGEDETC